MISKKSDKDILSIEKYDLSSKFENSEKYKKYSKILFWASLLSPIVALIFVLILWCINSFFVGNMWLFYLFVPFPAASVALGIHTKKRGIKFKKNVVCGIISLVLLLTVGTLSFIIKDKYTRSDKHLLKAEKIIGLDIPSYSDILTHRINIKISNGHVYYVCRAEFDSEKVQELEKSIETEDVWLSEIPDSMLEITSPSFYLKSAVDYTLIYNSTKGEINTVPEESGTYDFISIMYDLSKNEMEIVEYRINFVK